MIRFLHSLAASTLAKHGNKTRKERERANYCRFHDELASKVGKRIPWSAR